MSIISDALKKAQASLKLSKQQNPPATPPPEQKPDEPPQDISYVYDKIYAKPQDYSDPNKPKEKALPKTPVKKFAAWKSWALFLVLCTAAAAIAEHNYPHEKYWPQLSYRIRKDVLSKFKMPQNKTTHTPPAAPRPSEPKTAPSFFAMKPSTPSPAAHNGSLILNGVIVTQEKTAALINNEIYEVNDVVAGKTIVSINQDEVILKDETGTITLTTKGIE